MQITSQIDQLFQINSDTEFNAFALKIFHYQYDNNMVYQQYVNFHLNPTTIKNINHYSQIPFLPIEFFKTFDVLCKNQHIDQSFVSSGTTGELTSRHMVADLNIY